MEEIILKINYLWKELINPLIFESKLHYEKILSHRSRMATEPRRVKVPVERGVSQPGGYWNIIYEDTTIMIHKLSVLK